MDASGPHSRARRPAGPGRLLLLLPLLFLLVAVAHLLRREPLLSPRTPGVSSPDESVAAFTGELERQGGGWLSATLTPLHADPRRQAFERQSMAQRLDLDPGEPWRLTVRWELARGAGEPAPGPGRGETGAPLPPPGLALGPVEVRDARGQALGSLPAPAAREGEPVSPLRALFAPPQGALRPGQTADWILWGRAPAEGTRLVGLVPQDDPDFLAATGFGGPFPLRATSVRRGDLGQPLARLEREEAGKSGAPGTSERDDGSARENGR